MSNFRKDQLQELSMNIVKDSKRRVVYYDAIKKEGYLMGANDRNWVLLFNMRYIVAVLVALLLTNFLPQYLLVWMGVGLIVFFGAHWLFKKYFLSNKVPLKVAQKDIDQMYLPEVLKHKRTFELYYLILAAIVVFFVITLVIGTETSYDIVTQIVSIGLVLAVLVYRALEFMAINNQYKIASSSIQ